MEASDTSSDNTEKHYGDLHRELAHQLYLSRDEVKRLSMRVAELKSSLSYKLSSPIRIVERLVASLRKRLTSENLTGMLVRGHRQPLINFRSLPGKSLTELYHAWVKAYDRVEERDLKLMKNDIEAFPERPVVSVAILAADSTTHEDLIASINSLCKQVYSDLDVLVCCSQRNRSVSSIPAQIADPRVRVVRTLATHSAAATFNELLNQAKGKYFISIEPGDILSPYAFYLIVRAAIDDPVLRVIYGDEDEFNADGDRCNPFFKPDWDPELALAFNYLGGAVVYQTHALRDIGGARPSISEDAWRWDLTLRITNGAPAQHICRLPFLLCHCGAVSLDRRRREVEAGAAIVADELARRGETAKITIHDGRRLILSRPIREKAPHVTIIIPTRDRCELLRRCVAGLLHRTIYPRFDILIIDNDSREADTLEYFRQLQCDSRVKVARSSQSFNFAAINNMAVELARGEVIALINNDIDVITPHWLAEMVGHAVRPEIGLVGAKLYYPDNTIQHAGMVMGLWGIAGHIFQRSLRSDPGPFDLAIMPRSVAAVTGACMVLRRTVYCEVGGMDEAFPTEFNDVDLCLKIGDRGLRIVWTPHAELYHLESATRGPSTDCDRSRAARKRFCERWRPVIANDPFFNPNLSLSDSCCGIAFPPRVQRPPNAHVAAT